jgi:formate dehydrogenase major subunit
VTGQERFRWPVLRQLKARDLRVSSDSAISSQTRDIAARTSDADRVVKSICPYCAVGCGQNVYVSGDTITNIEGDPDSPISRGRLCPKGAATYELVTGPHRQTKVLYRPPHGTRWEPIGLDRAMDMVAERVKDARDSTWEDKTKDGKPLHRTMSFAHLGGATLDNEENYLIKKLFTALGAVQIENQARI